MLLLLTICNYVSIEVRICEDTYTRTFIYIYVCVSVCECVCVCTYAYLYSNNNKNTSFHREKGTRQASNWHFMLPSHVKLKSKCINKKNELSH